MDPTKTPASKLTAIMQFYEEVPKETLPELQVQFLAYIGATSQLPSNNPFGADSGKSMYSEHVNI